MTSVPNKGSSTNFSSEENVRYSRHFSLKQVGVHGQTLLKDAKVLVIGAGGLGCPVLQYLAAAGVGQLTIVDGDEVSLSNLQRQILFSTDQIGQPKSQAAVQKLRALNPDINILAVPEYFQIDNALSLVSQCDIVVDGTDNFQTRYLINDACVMAKKPFVYASISQFTGQLSVFNHSVELKSESKSKPESRGPTYRCLFPEPPAPDSIPSCAEAGVLGALPGVLGTLQAVEVLKMILKLPGIKSGVLVLLDLLGQISQEIQLTPSPQSQQIKELVIPEMYCSTSQPPSEASLSLDPFDFQDLREQELITIVDVRADWEYTDDLTPHHLPLDEIEENSNSELSQRISQISNSHPSHKIVLVCNYGKKSLQAAGILQKALSESTFLSLEGGIEGLERLGLLR